MPRTIFIDASAWVALADADDSAHEAARHAFPLVERLWSHWVTSNLVVAEAHILIRRRSSHAEAMRFLAKIRATRRLTRVYSDEALESQAEAILQRYQDQEFSLADAVSFVVMRRHKITEAFAFDQHFATAGFTLIPAR